jgi:hypothetical protein
MSSRTVFLSRLIGLYCFLAALSMMIRKETIIETVTALLHDSPLMFIVGILTLVGGLAMVIAHNIWSGGAPAVVVTLVGWLTLAKGLLFLFLPPELEAEFFLSKLHYKKLFYVYTAISLVIGIYLIYEGFRSRSSS